MAIGVGQLLQISLVARVASSDVMNVWSYEVMSSPALITATHVGEAWWNHVSSVYRAMSQVAAGPVFQSVLVKELGNPVGELGEFAIPTAEKTGTRATTAAPNMLPAFNAAGARLIVSSRLTRPGQKRFPFLTEADSSDDSVEAAFLTLVGNTLDVANSTIILGAPAATLTLAPVVVGLNADGTIRAHQPTLGHVLNPYVTSQVSRKHGRGM